MSIKKSTTVKAQAKTVSKSKATAKQVVSNESLRAEIAELKKQIAALSSQCHSCCADLKQIKDKAQDDTAVALLNLLASSTSFAQFQHFAKKIAK